MPRDTSTGPVVAPDAPEVLGRRERKKRATRDALSAAALRLALAQGVENVTLEQITDEADIALRTFFNYFSGKEEAIVAGEAANADRLVAAFRARPPTESVLEALREAVLAAMEGLDVTRAEPMEALRLVSEAPSLRPHRLAVLVGAEASLATAITARVGAAEPAAGPDGAAREPLYPALCAAAAMAALRVVQQRWLALASSAARSHRTLPVDVLHEELDTVITQLALGFDHPGHPVRSR